MEKTIAPNFRKKKSFIGQSCFDCVFFVYSTGFCVLYRQHIKRSVLHVCDDFEEEYAETRRNNANNLQPKRNG